MTKDQHPLIWELRKPKKRSKGTISYSLNPHKDGNAQKGIKNVKNKNNCCQTSKISAKEAN